MNKFLISIIIPTYNRTDLLKNAIQSVIDQTYKDIEIIVVDDASTCDNSLIIESFEVPIKYYRFDTNKGGNICRNKGVELANGDYVAFLDDDDTWDKRKLEKQLSLINKTGAKLCYTGKNIITVDDNLQETKNRYSFAKPKFRNLQKSIMYKNFIGTTSSIIVEKKSFFKVGQFDVLMPALQDYEFYIRFIHSEFKVVGINEGLVNYFIYHNSSAISKSINKKILAMKIILRNYKSYKYLYLIYFDFLRNIIKSLLLGHK